MKTRLTLTAAALALLAACNNTATTETENPEQSIDSSRLRDEAAIDESPGAPQGPATLFPELFGKLQQQDTSFTAAKLEAWQTEADSSKPLPLDTAQLAPFRPYLLYNADSSMAIDMVSYNFVLRRKNGQPQLTQAGPDSELALIDFKQGTRRRILFLGTAGFLLEAKWQNNQYIAAAGAEEAGGALIPLLWRYDTQEKSLESYRYEGTVQANLGNYAEDLLNERRK